MCVCVYVYIYIYIYISFWKINNFGFGNPFSILFLRNKSCFYIVLVDESDLQRDKVANIWLWHMAICSLSTLTHALLLARRYINKECCM